MELEPVYKLAISIMVGIVSFCSVIIVSLIVWIWKKTQKSHQTNKINQETFNKEILMNLNKLNENTNKSLLSIKNLWNYTRKIKVNQDRMDNHISGLSKKVDKLMKE